MPKFLTLEKEAFGLDISDLSLKIVNLKKKNMSFSLASFNETDIEAGVIEKGIIQNEDALAKSIMSACKNVQGKKLTTKYVIASLPEEKSFLQVIQMPKMEEEELRSAIIFEAENYIPLPINEVYLDFQIITPMKDNHGHLDVLIVAMPKKIVNSYVSCLKKAGLMPLALEVESQAIARTLIENETSTSPIILVDFGKNSTDFIVFFGRSIRFTYSIPISSFQLTLAISKSLEVTLKEAEKLKMKCDLTKTTTKNESSKKVLQAINPILEDMAVQVKKYINFYQDHASDEHLSSNEKIEHILFCGGGANLKGLPEYFSERLGVPVKIGDPWINFPAKRPASQINQDPLSFVTALGLALRGIQK